MDHDIHGWKRYAYFLTVSGIIVASIVLAFGIRAAWKESRTQTQCLERIVTAHMPSQLEKVWNAVTPEVAIAEIEAVTWITIKEHPRKHWYSHRSFCSDSFWVRMFREIRAVELRTITKPGSTNELVSAAVRSAQSGYYRFFKPNEYACASRLATLLDASPLFLRADYMRVGEPIGRVYLYGLKSECRKRR